MQNLDNDMFGASLFCEQNRWAEQTGQSLKYISELNKLSMGRGRSISAKCVRGIDVFIF